MAHDLEKFPRQEPAAEAPEARAEVPEAAAEAPEASAEAVDEAVEDAGKEFETASAELASFGSAELARVTADAAPDELDDPELAEAGQELDEVAAQGRALTEKHKGLLATIGGKVKRLAQRAVLGVTLAGAAMSAGEARAEKPDAAPKVEHVEKGPEQGPLAKKAIEAMYANEKLAKERTPEQLKDFAEAIGRADMDKLTDALAEISGLPRADLQKETVDELLILSQEELKEMKAKDPRSVDLKMKAVTTRDKVLMRAEAFIGPDGKVDKEEFAHTFAHESEHARHSRRDKVRYGEQVRPWDDTLPHGLQEGVTEVLALRSLERSGEKSSDQSYAGGNFAAGFLLEKTVGTRAMARDYLKGETKEMRAVLEKKFGADGADRILRKHFYSGMGASGEDPEGLSTALDIVRETARAGMDADALVGSAKAEGVVESMSVLEKGRGILLSKEIPHDETRVVANAALEDAAGLSEHAPPVRLHLVSTKGGGWPLESFDAASLRERAMKGAEVVEATRRAFKEQNKLGDDFEKDPVAMETYKLQLDQAFAGAKLVSPGDTFNMVVNVEAATQPFREAYDKAKTDGERDAVRAQMADFVAKTAKDLLAKVGKEAKNEKQ